MPKEENKKQINNIKVDMGKIHKDLEFIKQSAQEANKRNDGEHAELKKIIKDFIDSADKKYASKSIEKIVNGLLLTITGAITAAIVAAIFKYLI